MDALGIFRLVASEFSNMPDDDEVDPDTGKVIQYGVTSFLSLFSDQISERRFGSSYQKALAYLTAHKLKMEKMKALDLSGCLSALILCLRENRP